MTPDEHAALVEPEMRLPQGTTCDDCWSFNRCKAFGVTKPGQRHCDWSPSAFREANARPESPQGRML